MIGDFIEYASVNLAAGASHTITASTGFTDDGTVLVVNDGAGGAPSTYDLKIEVYVDALAKWVEVENKAGITALTHTHVGLPSQMRWTVTNPSGTTAFDYDIVAYGLKPN